MSLHNEYVLSETTKARRDEIKTAQGRKEFGGKKQLLSFEVIKKMPLTYFY